MGIRVWADALSPATEVDKLSFSIALAPFTGMEAALCYYIFQYSHFVIGVMTVVCSMGH